MRKHDSESAHAIQHSSSMTTVADCKIESKTGTIRFLNRSRDICLKGVDSTADTWDALEAGKELAKRYGNVVAISGKEDLVSSCQDV